VSDVELIWPGKFDPDGGRAPIPRSAPTPSFKVVERHPDEAGHTPGTLAWGDNLRWLDALERSSAGKVDLVYMDPPFCTQKRFSATRSVGESGETVTLPAYADTFSGGVGEYLAMLDPRLRLVHALLADHGSVYVHVDANVGPAVKLLLDEIFGPDGFQREIIWRIGWVSGFKTRARNWIRNHDCIYFYAKNPSKLRFNKQYLPHPPGYRRRAGAPAKAPGIAIDDVWNASEAARALKGSASLDSIQIKSFSREKSGWATQKNESLLARIIAASSDPGDWVVDPFSGAGTTAAVAHALGRRFSVCDRSGLATMLARQRLLELGAPMEIVAEPGRPLAFAGGEGLSGPGVDAAHAEGRVELRGLRAEVWPEALSSRDWFERVESWGVVDARGSVLADVRRDADRRLALGVDLDDRSVEHAAAVFAWDVLGRRWVRSLD
jgi:DNA modification methylase